MKRVIEVIPPEGTRQFYDTDLPLAIGSGRDAQIPIPEGDTVAAWLAESRGYLFLQAVETAAPVFHNDEHLQRSAWIKSGDITRIGNTLLFWVLAGDRVEIKVQRAGEVSLTPPSLSPLESGDETNGQARSTRKSLPRTGKRVQRVGNKGRWFSAGILLLLLVLAAVFLLSAQRIQVTVQPEPDSLSVSGFPLAFKIGHSLLVLKGTYTLQAEKEGYRRLSEQIIVSADSARHAVFVMEKLPGKVDISSRPVAGASVFVDDQLLGVTPLIDQEIAAGEHLLRFELDRYLTQEQQLLVIGGGEQQVVEVELQPGWGTLILTSDPVGATVNQGDQVLGTTPITVELMAGEVVVHMRKEGFLPAELAVTVMAGEQAAPEPVQLEPVPAEVRLGSVPGGAMVEIAGKFVGTTPLTLSLPVEVQHEIRLSLAGSKPKTIRRSFVSGGPQEISINLEPLYGTILLSTDPVDATLFIDGKKHGPATGRLRLTTREHQLKIEADGYEIATRTVLPRDGHNQQLEVRLRKKGEPAQPVIFPGLQQKGKFIALGPGVIQMGAARREPGRRANEQERTVQLVRPFLMAVYPVTNAEYRRFRSGHRSGSVRGQTLDGDKQPVVNISWDDAARYCNWLSVQDGLPPFYVMKGDTMVAGSPANTGYRLPTEAEWSFAARMAGRQERARYPWFGKFPPGKPSGNFGDESASGILPVVLRGYNDGFAVTSPVGSFPKNSGGFFDLGGNVSQWCHDWYTAYASIGGQKILADSMGPGTGSHHVVRGSSWRDATITTLRLSYRGYGKGGRDDIGFRLARYMK